MDDLTLGDLIDGTQAHRDSIAARFASPSDDEVEPEPEETGDEDTETTDQDQGSEPEGLSEEALSRLIETASQAGPTSPLPPEEASDDGLEDETSTDGGKRTPARRGAALGDQFADAILNYRDGSSAPRGLNEALRRRAKGVGVFGDNR